jgi:hypothetical protein
MGLDITLLSYRGETIETIGDPKNFLHKILPPADEESDNLLTKIDWYGDTFFNYLQMKRFLAEWGSLAARARTTDEQNLLASVRSLAMRCQKDRGILKFTGD